jgi:hypothetical protein
MAGGDVGGEFTMAAAKGLHEGVPGGQVPRGPVASDPAHRPQPRFQPPVIGLDRVVRVPLDGMQRRGDQLIQDPRMGRARSVVTSAAGAIAALFGLIFALPIAVAALPASILAAARKLDRVVDLHVSSARLVRR